MNPTPTPPPPQDNNRVDGDSDHKKVDEEIILPNYDFQPINRQFTAASSVSNLPSAAAHIGGSSSTRPWSSSDSKINSDVQFKIEPTTFKIGTEPSFSEGAMSEIDQIMKKHADNLMHVLEGVSSRLTQMESRTRHLENVLDDLKVSVGNYYGSIDGKMRQLENIMREVQTGVEVVKDKQEILEAQLQLAKLQVSTKVDQQPERQSSVQFDLVPQQSYQQLPLPTTSRQQSVNPQPSLPDAPPPPPPPQVNAQLPNQYPQSQSLPPSQREPYFPPSGQTQEAPYPLYPVGPVTPLPPVLQSQAPPQQPYPPAPQPQYSQPSQPQQPQHHPSQPPVNSAPPQPSLAHNHEEPPYIPAQNYPPNLRQPSSQPPGGPPPTQQFYGGIYEQPPPSRSSTGFPTGYGSQQSGPIEPYGYGGPPSQYSPSSAIKPQQFPSQSSGASGYPQLPTARVLPQAQALPTASSVSSAGSGSPGTGNKVPIDDVVEKVTNMGFPKEHVRATVRKLIENGQLVDLNVVLDKLMNDTDVPPPRAWFGR
jgi:hypothetical protein